MIGHYVVNNIEIGSEDNSNEKNEMTRKLMEEFSEDFIDMEGGY